MMKVYVTVMHRWGEEDNHSYIEGVYTSKEHAVNAGWANKIYRGGKYEPTVYEKDIVTEDRTHPTGDKQWMREYNSR